MTDTPNFDPEVDLDWDVDKHGHMADYATNDDEVEMEDPDEETE